MKRNKNGRKEKENYIGLAVDETFRSGSRIGDPAALPFVPVPVPGQMRSAGMAATGLASERAVKLPRFEAE